MRSKYKLHLLTGVLAALFPVVTLAQFTPPESVEGIELKQVENGVEVSWDAVDGEIDHYRIYIAERSIIEHDGEFDDFEVTEGPETSMVIPVPGDAKELFVTVAAVDEDKLESEFFVEEGHIVLEENAEPTQEEKEVKEERHEGMAQLLITDVVSPTEVEVTFSLPMTVTDQEKAPDGLKITDPEGNPLPIQSITIEGVAIIVKTEEQTKGTVYRIEFSEPFVGKGGEALHPTDRSALFTGHEDGKEPEPKEEPKVVEPIDPRSPPDVANVRISATAQQNGLASVVIEWDPLPTQGLYGIIVYQTRDNGQTWGLPDVLPVELRGVELADVTPGPFGVFIQTMSSEGYISKGVFENTFIPVEIPGYGVWRAETSEQDQMAPVTHPTQELAPLEPIEDDKETTIERQPVIAAAGFGIGKVAISLMIASVSVAAAVISWISVRRIRKFHEA